MKNEDKQAPAPYQPDFLSGRERLYGVPEAARELKLSRSRVRELIRRGELAYVLRTGFSRRVYHVPASALQSYLELRAARARLKQAQRANRRHVELAAKFRKNFRE